MALRRFVHSLVDVEPAPAVFNPWLDFDRPHDIGPSAPLIRRRQLGHYLNVRRAEAHYALIGEALGYQGGHFSGIAMTSERILLGHKSEEGVDPEAVLPGLNPERTSRPDLKAQGFSEPTATIVWKALLEQGLSGTDFILWNTFPWHPFNDKRGVLSNRKPTMQELDSGEPVLRRFLSLFQECKVIAVGKVATEQLSALAVDHVAVRHPARGGAPIFHQEMRLMLS